MVAGHLQEKKGYYYAVLSYKDADKRRRTKWIASGLPVKGNKKKAEGFLQEQRRSFEIPLADQPIAKDGQELFADYLQRWLQVAKTTVAPTTYGSYGGLLRNPIDPWFRKKRITLQGLTASDLQAFYMEQGRRVKPNTVIHYHAVIHRALKYAVKMDLISVNPADKVDRPRKNGYQANFYSESEIAALFAAISDTLIEVPVKLAAFYGLRRSEVMGLRWDAVDFVHNTICIRHTVTGCTIDGQYQIIAADTTKTRSSRRTLPLVPTVREMLLRLKEQQEQNRKICGQSYSREFADYICVNKLGERIRPAYLSSCFSKALEQNHLRHIRFHDLRHPYAKHTTKIFSLRLIDFQAQAYPDARRKTRGACQLLRVGQSRSPVRPLCNRKRFSCLPPQSKMSWILYAISMRLSGYTSTRSISSSASSVVSVSASKIALDASLRLSCRACSSCFFFACANTAA